MKTRPVRYGRDIAFVIDKDICEQLNITEESLFDVQVEDGKLVVTPMVDEERRAAFEEALRMVNERYGKTLKRLADS